MLFGGNDEVGQRLIELFVVDNLVNEVVKRLSGCIEVDEENEIFFSFLEGNFEGFVEKVKFGFIKQLIVDKFDLVVEEEVRKQEELRKK